MSFSRLGLTATPGRPKTFTAKGDTESTARPDKRYSSLGLSGVMMALRPAFEAKAAGIGIAARTVLELLPSATITIGHRRTVLTDLVLGIRPMGATITVAKTSSRIGRTTVSLGVRATLNYRREGAHHAFQGGTEIAFGTFGSVQYRYRRSTVGTNTVTITAGGVRTYTPAPVRNHQILGGARVRLTPMSAIAKASGGQHYSYSGTAALDLGVFGRITVVRQTTYTQHGSLTVRLTPQATIVKGEGPPQAYAVLGGSVLSLTPSAALGYNTAEVDQHAILGHTAFSLAPRAIITPRRAPSVTPLNSVPRGRRRFIRLFNR